MTPDTQISISLIVSVISISFVAVTFFSGRKKDTQKESEQLIKANMKLDQICSTTNETRSDIKAINNQIKEITEEQIIQRQEIKAIWKNIDQIKEKIE